MDIFKFANDPSTPTKMENGQIVNGIKSKMWVERYAEAGEFTLKAPVSSGLQITLPLGTFISHINTSEIMIVENHEINEDQDKEPWITITGRGYETFLENRQVGIKHPFSITRASDINDSTGDLYLAIQIMDLILHHVYPPFSGNADYSVLYLNILNNIDVGDDIYAGTRLFEPGNVYERVLDLLNSGNYGIKVVRPLIVPIDTFNPENTVFLIHKGIDKSKTVLFSQEAGDVVSADYFWSNRDLKNIAYVSSKWVAIVVGPIDPFDIHIKARIMHIDASDLDNDLSESPTAAEFTPLWRRMKRRGLDALNNQTPIVLTKAEISKEGTKAQYRTDFDVGDLVTVRGNYNTISRMRVKEFVEIEDETGEFSYPTLSLDPVIVTSTQTVDSMLYKFGSFTWNGSTDPLLPTYTVVFDHSFITAEYTILLSEEVYTVSDPIDEIVPGTLRSDLQTPEGFRVTRSAHPNTDPDHGVRIYWWAFFSENLEGTIIES